MIHAVCPGCKVETEIEPEQLQGVDIVGCNECGRQFRFTLLGNLLTFGEEVEEEDEDPGEDGEFCDDCNEPIEDCTCTDDDDSEDDEESEDVEEGEDGDA